MSGAFAFSTVDDSADPTFNQLLGVNDHGVIAGYFGSGNPASTHPNKGYTIKIENGTPTFTDENVPQSAQTQVTGIASDGTTVGFSVDGAGNNFGFVDWNGQFTQVANPASPNNNQLLGVSERGKAAGFYTDADNHEHGYIYDIRNKTFTPVTVNISGAVSTQATGIDNHGDISGFTTDANGNSTGFVIMGGQMTTIQAPGSNNTQVLGINNQGQAVGQYVDGAGNTHGFVWTNNALKTVDDPNGAGGTTVNGLNDNGELVGFYVDAAKNTHGFVARRG
jgi:probable HAF family extracellular repeat protein